MFGWKQKIIESPIPIVETRCIVVQMIDDDPEAWVSYYTKFTPEKKSAAQKQYEYLMGARGGPPNINLYHKDIDVCLHIDYNTHIVTKVSRNGHTLPVDVLAVANALRRRDAYFARKKSDAALAELNSLEQDVATYNYGKLIALRAELVEAEANHLKGLISV